ncbi:MAG: CPBP family intramembrane metalloprotease [Cyclobacteriaceae bacterium]|nr:CPBP family intramembrane metalloprotease [Cyclobacteriaceae bacterium]
MISPISDKRRILEITAVLITAAGKFIFMDYLNWRLPFVATATLVWISYIIYTGKTDKELLKYHGFRTDNFKAVAKMILPFGIVAIISFIAIGYYQSTLNLTWHIIPILITYPIWGTIQQYLLIALTLGNMQDLENQKINNPILIFGAALLFSALHYPDKWLMIGTFVLALFYGWIYSRKRNLYVLGIFHGVLGGLFYYTVLDRDPFIETMGKLFINK